MKFSLLMSILCVLVPNVQAQPRRSHGIAAQTINHTRRADSGESLPIRRVILYSNGVAYIERRGVISDNAEVNLSFRQSQVDDVLKSMVVLDLGQGRIGAVSYNSSAPPSARMADIPFSISAASADGSSGGLAGVLSQLQGARVAVTTSGGRQVAGSVLTVEQRKSQIDAGKPPVMRYALVVNTDGGELSSFDLADVRAVRLLDEGARRDVSEFASASASARRRDAKTIVVTSEGTGKREMLISYIIAAPIWKTTYRVVLDAAGQPFFQGWAIVDNVSDEDWTNISLSLISGSPVSFIQSIQQPLYRYRPVVAMRTDLKLSPQIYEPTELSSAGAAIGSITGRITDGAGAVIPGVTVTVGNNASGDDDTGVTDGEGNFKIEGLSAGTYNLSAEAPGFKQSVVQNIRVGGPSPTRVNLSLEVGAVSETVTVTAAEEPLRVSSLSLGSMQPSLVSVGRAISGENSGVVAAATGDEVGDLFEYRIGHAVTVRRDRSALIPILQTRMDGARVSIFNEAARSDRPMSGLLLKNTSSLTLEDGALTVIDSDAYAGEALMERLKPGEQRLISFALDLGTLVNVRAQGGQTPAYRVRILNGTFHAHRYETEEKLYTITNQTERPRIVYVEHPVRSGWELTQDTQQPETKTARHYRFRVELKPHTTAQLSVAEQRELSNSYALSNITPRELELFVAQRYIDEQTRAALEKITELKGRLALLNARVEETNKESNLIAEDQKRLRENIKALSDTTEAKQLIARYVAKADEQETRIEQLTRERQAASDERERLQRELDDSIRALALDRKV